MSGLIAFWNILKKDIWKYYLKPPNISWGIIFPLSWTLMQIIRSPGDLDIMELLPGLMGMSVLFGTTSMLAVTITFERKGRSFERLLLAPIGLNTLVLAKISGAVMFGIFNAFVPLVLASFLTDLSGINWTLVILGVFLVAVSYTLLGLMVAVSVQEVFEAQTLSNFFRFPMLFLCGLFVPIERLPAILKPLSFCLPLTYGTDILRASILGSSLMNRYLSIFMMFVFIGILFYLSRRNINRKWIL